MPAPNLPTSLLSLFGLCCACASDPTPLWEPVASSVSLTASAADRIVDPLNVEVLPVHPPGRHPLLGRFRLGCGRTFNWEDADLMDEMKQKAASLGGNTIVCTDEEPTHVFVYYIPEDCGSHGGDDE